MFIIMTCDDSDALAVEKTQWRLPSQWVDVLAIVPLQLGSGPLREEFFAALQVCMHAR